MQETGEKYSIQNLTNFAEAVFRSMGFSDEHARLSAACLLRADLRGIDSHGIARLSGYVRLTKSGRLNPLPDLKFRVGFMAAGLLNADRAIGFIAATEAMNHCIRMAKEFGCGMVAVQNSNHFGVAGQYALMAAEQGLAGFAFTNASPLVAPTNSIDRLLGTNPIAAAFPSQTSRPFVLDMATTTAANGKLEILQRKGENTPDGWLQDSVGKGSNDPEELKKGGALLPLGGSPETAGHKGYGLGSLVDILAGVCSGANFGPWVPPFVSFLPLPENPVGEGIGHFFMAFRPDAFIPSEEYLERMEKWMQAMRTSRPSGTPAVLVAGDPEWQAEAERSIHGISLHPEVLKDLALLAEEFSIPALTVG